VRRFNDTFNAEAQSTRRSPVCVPNLGVLRVSAVSRLFQNERPRIGIERVLGIRQRDAEAPRILSVSAASDGLQRRHNGALLRIVASRLVLVAALVVAACGRQAASEEGEAAAVPTIAADVGRVARQDLVDALVVRGAIAAVPNEDVRISALVPGHVVSMKVAEGDFVRAGQVVAEIDPRPLEDQRRQAAAALSQAKAGLENAKLNLARTERLFERGIAAGKEVEDARNQEAAAQAGLEQAAALLDSAERQVARTKVASPIAGQVVKRLVNVGEQVDGTAAQPLLEVANLDHVELAANVPADRLASVRVGQKAEVSVEGSTERFAGEVIAVAPAIDPATNAAIARVRLANPARILKVGMFAQARVAIGARKGALTVPPSAIAKDEAGDAAVYVVANGVAQRTPVTLGLATQEAVEVLSGVSEGQEVLTSSVHGLGEKAKLGKAS
jgi:RND family efflux transporter MFP subunit